MRGTNARGQGRPLEEALEGIPPDRLRAQDKRRFAEWARGLDDRHGACGVGSILGVVCVRPGR